MAEAESDTTERCRALTADGERCSRAAQENGFCFQHDNSDRTVSESQQQTHDTDEEDSDVEAEDEDVDETTGEESESESESEADQDDGGASEADQDDGGASEADQDDGEGSAQEADAVEGEREGKDTTDPESVATSDVDVEHDEIEAVMSIRRTVESTAETLIGHPFDSVSEISPTQDGWGAIVEVIERSAIPDTQDVIGRYEIDLDEEGVVEGYRRVNRYRRGDTETFE